jgi:hypothetical protein
MANAINARIQGDDYQARIFWLMVTRLFGEETRVTRVGWEVDDVVGFDDIAVFYDGDHGDGIDPNVKVDFFQSKFHVTHERAFTAAALIEPSFIGATTQSLLQRLKDAQQKYAPTGVEARFTVIAPTTIDPSDPLAELVSCVDGSIRLDRLAEGQTDRSRMGAIRAMWRRHLSLDSDEQLFEVLKPLRIRADYGSLEALRERLNAALPFIGMRPHSEGSLGNVYDSLPAKLAQLDRHIYDKRSIDALAEKERLRTPVVTARASRSRQLGVRSFLRWAEHMEDDTETMLCLLHCFDDREIRDPAFWSGVVLPELEEWFGQSIKSGDSIDLHLDVHSSIALAAGWILNSKSGVAVSPVQRTRRGKEVWCPEESEKCTGEALWNASVYESHEEGSDLAIVLDVTHATTNEVLKYVAANVPEIRKVVSLTACQGVGAASVKHADHALQMAREAVRLARVQLEFHPRKAKVHLFAAAPNGLLFFLGQSAHALGTCISYEYDFRRQNDTAYSRSIMLTESQRIL